MTKVSQRLLYGASSLSLMMSSAVANAAENPPGTDNYQIQEIIVTATKQQRNLQDVPQSIQALGADQLRAQRITSVQDLTTVVPSFSVAPTYSGVPVYTLRGIGFFDTSVASYPTVSLYVDEAPLPFAALTSHSDYDLERVEVLKGPQGTLFGQNATGGAINFIAAKPTDSFKAGFDVSYGRFNEVVADGFVSGPLSDALSIRVAGRYHRSEGWQISNSRPWDRNGATKTWMGRIILAYNPTDRLRLNLNVNGWVDKSDTQAAQVIAFNYQGSIIGPDLAAQSISPYKIRAADWSPGLPASNNRFFQAFLRGEYDLSDSISLTSISSYIRYRHDQDVDADGLPIEVNDLSDNRANVDSYYQELRLDNGSATRFRWLLGANYQYNKADTEIAGNRFSQSSANSTYAAFGYPDVDITVPTSSQRFNSYAAFANLDFDIVPTVTVSGGIRYTKSTDKASACNSDPVGLPTGIGALLYDVVYGGSQGPYVAGECFMFNNLGVPMGDTQPGQTGPLVDRLSEDNVSWKAGASWKPAEDTMLYFNVSKGYKAGSYPLTGGTVLSQYLPVKQESVLAYEAGIKTTLLDRRLQINAAVFYYDYKDKQTQVRFFDQTFGFLARLTNLPNSRVEGGEISVTATPIPGLNLNANLTYTDATVREFTGINSAGISADFSGARLPYSSKWDMTANASYDFAVTGSANAFLGANVAHRSKAYSVFGGDQNPPRANPNNLCLFCIDPYTTVGFNLGVRDRNEAWRVTFWGKNIFNEYYWHNVGLVFDTITRYTAKPATYGVTVSGRF